MLGPLLFLLPLPLVAGDDDPPPVDYQRDIRPILSDHCFACHGPDEGARQAGLRLDTADGARAALAATDGGHGELLLRVTEEDDALRMPPPETGKEIDAAELAVLERWIEEGADYSTHWSFVPPERSALPQVQTADWARQPLDHFVLARLEAEGLAPEPEADRATLARRATLALTGLPPTPQELDAFLADESEGAYERLVDRLLASQRYGEHMAHYWLDAARYADTHGLHLDNERSMWLWRDQVVRALNADQPFDQFTIEQLAGDLLPEPTIEQRVASGFNRCNPTSAEGGMIAAEYLSIYAKDRVDTVSTIWLGLTMACAKCHDHKFDPLSMRDYYSLYGFFNNLAEEASDRNITNPVPFLRVPDAEQQAQLDALDAEATSLSARVDEPMPEVDAAQAAWESGWEERLTDRWQVLTAAALEAREGTTLTQDADGVIVAGGENPDTEAYVIETSSTLGEVRGLRLEALCGAPGSDKLPGRATNHNFVLSEVELEAWPLGQPEAARRVPIGRAYASFSQDKWPIAAVLDGEANTGWAGLGLDGDRSAVLVPEQPIAFPAGVALRVTLRFDSIHLQHSFGRFRLAATDDAALAPLETGTWSQSPIFGARDGRGTFERPYAPENAELVDGVAWDPHPEFVDGQTHLFASEPGSTYLRRTLHAPTARTVRLGLGSDDGLRVWLDGDLVHSNPTARGVALDQDVVEVDLSAGEHTLMLKVANYGGGFGFSFRVQEEYHEDLPPALSLALEQPPETRGAAVQERLRRHFRRNHAPEWIALNDRLQELRTERADFENALPTTMVASERDEMRPAHLLMRGEYDQVGEEVQRATPAALPPLAADLSRDRLGLAQWLLDEANPLTARVTVNRHWLRFFGTGLVKTAEDFGAQGEFPSHPELLDWLAVEFREQGWSLKRLHRDLVTSAAFRQRARISPEKLARDPDNRLLSRGPSFRLDAEVIRDQALFVSGLLVEREGGKNGRPYQPEGIWKAVGYTRSNTANFRQDEGEANWRRSLYTFWKRTAPPPNLAIFDAPSRESCTVRRERTNTPLQALALLNDRQFVEAARCFAARLLRGEFAGDDARVAHAFRSVTSRMPEERERDELLLLLRDARAHFEGDAAGAASLRAVGDAPVDEELPAAEHASWTLLANLLLNLDETVTLH